MKLIRMMLCYSRPLEKTVDEADNLRLKLENMPTNTVEDVKAQEELLKEAEEDLATALAADLLVASEFWGEKETTEERLHQAVNLSVKQFESETVEGFRAIADRQCRGKKGKMFHWPLEFPEK